MHTYRWLRLPFGISSAPEEFQQRIGTLKEAEGDHDRRLIALMERCVKKDIKLNPDKLQFKLHEVKFMGHIISDKGMKSDPEKVSAIMQMPTPRNKADLLRMIWTDELLVTLLPEPQLLNTTSASTYQGWCGVHLFQTAR